MATPAQWIAGARLRTLPMAVAPVAVGAAAAFGASGQLHWVRAILALLVSLLLQIGVNYANDYSDGIRGTDDERVGPLRLTGSRLAKPSHVKAASFLCFGVAALAGLGLVLLSGSWPLLIVGVCAVFAAWGYTGGKHPYGYLGLGEVFVFLFFGLVATLGTTVTQINTFTASAWLGAVSVGLLAMALLMANNIRDIPTDREVGKNTLAVRLGDRPARLSYGVMVVVAGLLPAVLAVSNVWMLLPVLVSVAGLAPARTVLRAQSPQELIPVLKTTGILAIVFAVLFAAAEVLGRLA
ncbi:1,4-dihydroxy-2-naphthoate polyprenyltransferase [Galactobacter valiniphilus]|uniref:1,4-dihydroxy-2-naphthoate octaprenyltransferase n=1 Tax=Galactobacter valiniphilus TaxID=2676122 RepID=A0A399JGF3_9MICC|nr:1,4-dihydroxy-2-naphthoate polyprenyltransferase [Galactobacter valiniphilus]RII43757.1 1,4-dihydroxy-2-naphthoate polyprenyltransferase [Galactobacter valiniphilus]